LCLADGLGREKLWERAPPAKGSEAPGKMPEAVLTGAPTAPLESCGATFAGRLLPAFRLQGKLLQRRRLEVEDAGALGGVAAVHTEY